MSNYYRWYVDPIDGQVNEMISRELDSETSAQRRKKGVILKDGTETIKDLWEFRDYNLFSRVYRRCKGEGWKAKFFAQQADGPIRERSANFLLNPPRKPRKTFPRTTSENSSFS